MELNLSNHHFIVTGCSSGFGLAITETLCQEGARVTGVARRQDPLARLHHRWPELFTPIQGDLRQPNTRTRLVQACERELLHGVVINAGGPPAKSASETTLEDWDEAYQLVFRWKIDLVLRLVPTFINKQYGRILFIESQSIKQPIPALALSNSMRAAVAGFAKSLAGDLASHGITVNLLAPGPHATTAIERVIAYRAEKTGQSIEDTRKSMQANVPVGRFGEARELAALACWLLSPGAGFVTGQTISHDGGTVAGLFG